MRRIESPRYLGYADCPVCERPLRLEVGRVDTTSHGIVNIVESEVHHGHYAQIAIVRGDPLKEYHPEFVRQMREIHAA